jgi:hypothetical protein
VAVATIVDYLGGLALPDTPETGPAAALAGFRRQFYQCLTRRADALFELTDAVLCTPGPVRSLADLNRPGDLGGSDHCTPAGATRALC